MYIKNWTRVLCKLLARLIYSFFCLLVLGFVFVFGTGSLYIDPAVDLEFLTKQAGLEFTAIRGLCLLSAGIEGVRSHAWSQADC